MLHNQEDDGSEMQGAMITVRRKLSSVSDLRITAEWMGGYAEYHIGDRMTCP